jgi:hypothetical protein
VHAHDAIERFGGQIVRFGEIGDEGSLRVRRSEVEDVDPGRPAVAIAADVPRVLEFETSPADPAAVPVEEAVDVVSVDGLSAIVAELPACRLDSGGEEDTATSDPESPAENSSDLVEI